jgi:hypothetical protein
MTTSEGVPTMSKTDKVANLRKSRAARAEVPSTPSRKAARSSSKKDKPAKAPKKKASPTPSKEVRRVSKLEVIVGLMTRDGGCTVKDVLKATNWPTVSMPQQARAAGLELRKEKRDGVTYYSAG